MLSPLFGEMDSGATYLKHGLRSFYLPPLSFDPMTFWHSSNLYLAGTYLQYFPSRGQFIGVPSEVCIYNTLTLRSLCNHPVVFAQKR